LRAVRKLRLFVSVSLAALTLAGRAAAVDITTCGQTFEDTATLIGDLDCSGFAGPAIEGSGTFDLAGHVLTAGDDIAFRCTTGRCTVVSTGMPAEIVGAASSPKVCIWASGGTRLEVNDVTVRRCSIAISGDRIILENVTLTDTDRGLFSSAAAVFGISRVDIHDSTITAASTGLLGDYTRFFITGSSISGAAETGIEDWPNGNVTLTDSVITGNGIGIDATSCTLTNTTVDANLGHGADCHRVHMLGGSANGNGGSGIRVTGRANVRDAVIVGNGGSGLDGEYSTGEAALVARVRTSTIAGNGLDGIRAMRATVKESTIDGNSRYGVRVSAFGSFAYGVRPGRAKVKSSTVSANGLYGVLADGADGGAVACVFKTGAALVGSTTSGNGTDAECGTSIMCADVASCTLPKIAALAICGTSYQVDSGVPGLSWGVCSSD